MMIIYLIERNQKEEKDCYLYRINHHKQSRTAIINEKILLDERILLSDPPTNCLPWGATSPRGATSVGIPHKSYHIPSTYRIV